MHYMLLFHSKEQTEKQASVKIMSKMIEDAVNTVLDPDILQCLKIIAAVEKDSAVHIVSNMLHRLKENRTSYEKLSYIRHMLENRVEKYRDRHIDISGQALTKEFYESFFHGKRDKSLQDVRREIDEDIRILQEMLNEAVANAICIETPFLALGMQTMNNVINQVNGEKYQQFIANHIPKICVDEYADLQANDQKKIAYQRMKEEIGLILESIKKADVRDEKA